MLSLMQAVYLRHHGSHNGHQLGAIKAVVEDAEKLNGLERWQEFRRNVADLLDQLRALKTLGIMNRPRLPTNL